LIDLLYIKNFKGGNATINEDEQIINEKLRDYYLEELQEIDKAFNSKKLSELKDDEIKNLIEYVNSISDLTTNDETKIDGFGVSYLSALLSSYFPELIPIVDRRVLIKLKKMKSKLNIKISMAN